MYLSVVQMCCASHATALCPSAAAWLLAKARTRGVVLIPLERAVFTAWGSLAILYDHAGTALRVPEVDGLALTDLPTSAAFEAKLLVLRGKPGLSQDQ
jgi:hypothetical protein